MDQTTLKQYANRLLDGQLTLEDFVEQVARSATAEIEGSSLDMDRNRRCGFPEVVYGEGKTVEDLERIFSTLIAADVDVFATRISADKATILKGRFDTLHYNDLAQTARIEPNSTPREPMTGSVAVVTAGTSDQRVAQEALETLHWMNINTELIVDVGVAGPQRLLAKVGQLRRADAIVVVAGMEGALPSVVGGHVEVPVVAVPTSVGYGANFGGIAALLGMLNSCAANVTVVNIDAGFKGAYVAGLIARQSQKLASKNRD